MRRQDITDAARKYYKAAENLSESLIEGFEKKVANVDWHKHGQTQKGKSGFKLAFLISAICFASALEASTGTDNDHMGTQNAHNHLHLDSTTNNQITSAASESSCRKSGIPPLLENLNIEGLNLEDLDLDLGMDVFNIDDLNIEGFNKNSSPPKRQPCEDAPFEHLLLSGLS